MPYTYIHVNWVQSSHAQRIDIFAFVEAAPKPEAICGVIQKGSTWSCGAGNRPKLKNHVALFYFSEQQGAVWR